MQNLGAIRRPVQKNCLSSLIVDMYIFDIRKFPYLHRNHSLSAAESKLLMDRVTEEMIETKEKFDDQRRMQEMALQGRLSDRKKKKLADLVRHFYLICEST